MSGATAVSVGSVLRSRASFWTGCLIFVGVLIFVELFPKNNATPQTLRLFLTICYFGAAIGLCWQMRGARERYWKLYYQWKYEDAPPEMERSWQYMLDSVNYFTRWMVGLLTVFLVASAVCVLNEWFPLPTPLPTVASLVWWFGLISVLMYFSWSVTILEEILTHSRFLQRQVATCDHFQPRTLLRGNAPTSTSAEIKLPKKGFVAGGRAWSFGRLTQNMIVFGAIGSGKTNCVLNPMLEGLIASRGCREKLAGLVLDAKGDFRPKLERICKRYSRIEDLILLSLETEGMRWNPLDTDEDAEEVASSFLAAIQAVGVRDSQTSFFLDSAKKFIKNSIVMLRVTNDQDTPPSFAQIYDLVTDSDFLLERMEKMPDSNESTPRYGNLELCKRFFVYEWLEYHDEMKQSIKAQISNLLSPFMNDRVVEFTSGKSTIRLSELLEQGKILYLDLPAVGNSAIGRVMGVFLKLAYYKQVVAFPLEKERYSFFFCDEFQKYFTSQASVSDSQFFDISRQYNHINVVATHDLSSFMVEEEKKSVVENLISHCSIKVFLQNSHKETNEYASGLFGERIAEYINSNVSRSKWGPIRIGAGGQSLGVPKVRPDDFVKLGKPDPEGSDRAECYILDASGGRADVINRSACWRIYKV